MRKVFISLALVLIAWLSFPAIALATGSFSTPDYNVKLNSPRMHYREIPFNIEFDYLGKTYKNYQFQLQKLDSNGNVIETIRTFEGHSGTEAKVTLIYEFEEAGFPYMLRDTINAITVMKGYVEETPSSDFRISGGGREYFFALAINDVAYNTNNERGWLFDGTAYQQHLIEKGDYFILHYRIPYNSINNDYRIKIASENENTILYEFSMDDIYTFQGGTTINYRNSFIVVSTDGKIPEFIDNRDFIAEKSFIKADNPFTTVFEKGVYTMAGFDDKNVKRADGQSPLLVGNRRDREWNLTADSLSVREGSQIRWNVFRETEEIAEVFNKHTFLDIPRQDNFGYIISDKYQRITNVRYRVDDAIGIGKNGSIFWRINKGNNETISNWFFGISGNTFEYSFQQDYELRFPHPIQDNLKDLLASFGLDDTVGYMLFSVVTLIAVSFILAYYGAGTAVIAIANFGLIGIFATIGFIPLWLIIGMIMFAVLGLVTVFRGRND